MPGVTTHLPHLPSRASRRVPGRAASLRTYLPRPGARRLPGWARFAAIELGVWLGLYAAYLAVRMVAISGEAGAMANAREIVDVERYTGLLVETDVQGWLEPLHSLFSAYYMLMFGPLVAATLVGLALRRRAPTRELSRALLLAIAIASVVFVIFPAAPPRLVPELGIADTVGLAGSHDSGSFGGVKFNPYAAMPSMHVGWSLLVGLDALRRRPPPLAQGRRRRASRADDRDGRRDGQPLPARRRRRGRHRALLAGPRATACEPRAGPALAARAAAVPGCRWCGGRRPRSATATSSAGPAWSCSNASPAPTVTSADRAIAPPARRSRPLARRPATGAPAARGRLP